MKTEAFQYDCAILGAGPGGLVAALYLSRFKRKIVIIDSGHSRAQWIPRIRNLIGYGAGLTGLTLLQKLRKQVQLYKNDWILGEGEVRKKGSGFEIRVGQRKLTARTVILATGMKDTQPTISNVPELRRKGLLAYCPICDGYEHSDQVIGLLVRNAHGLRKIPTLSRFSRKIFVFQAQPFGITSQQKKKIEKFNCHFVEGQLQWMKAHLGRRGLTVKTEKAESLFVHVMYVALGVDFNLKTTRHLKKLRRTKEGFIQTKSHQETSIPGLYAVGDCVNALAQVSVAIGQAALAATRIHNQLDCTISVD